MTQPHDAGQTPPNEPTDYSKPVAYDTNGRPLYAHPPAAPQPTQEPIPNDANADTSSHQVVHFTRAMEPAAPVISDETRSRHEQSKRRFPTLNLSEGEYIISAVKRHPIGVLPWIAMPVFFTVGALLAIPFYADYHRAAAATGTPSVEIVSLILLFCMAIVWIIGLAAVYIYTQNKFFLTNESVIQEIRHSLFAHHEQTVSLANIEDASYRQSHVFEYFFNYGTIRLSTEGDETTYRFSYVTNPKKQIAILNNAVEAFKNGRPIGD